MAIAVAYQVTKINLYHYLHDSAGLLAETYQEQFGFLSLLLGQFTSKNEEKEALKKLTNGKITGEVADDREKMAIFR